MADNTDSSADSMEAHSTETTSAGNTGNSESIVAAASEESALEEIDSSAEKATNCPSEECEVNKPSASPSCDVDEATSVDSPANTTDHDPPSMKLNEMTDNDVAEPNSEPQTETAKELNNSSTDASSTTSESSPHLTETVGDYENATTDKDVVDKNHKIEAEQNAAIESQVDTEHGQKDEQNASRKDTEPSASMPTSSTVESPEQASSTGAEAAGPEKSPLQSVYHIKWIYFNESMYPIVTQNENGPCPLLAIMNLLVLQGKIKMPPMIEIVTSGQLMEYLADCIFEHAPKDITEDARLNYEQNMHDAMAVFHKLQTGLDVNVKFTSVSTFEYTSECIVFDLLGIPLYHGWLVDPDSPSEVAAIGNCGYNQLVEKIITQKNSAREELVTEALIAEEFLNRSAAQLTYYGLSELSTTVNDGQLCVFFRNNHFSTLFKRKNELFILVTDQGFLTESNVVWETLSNVEGDGHFVDASFHTYRKSEPSNHTIPSSTIPVGTPQQVDQDYLVALSLQEEQSTASPQPPAAAKDLPPEEAFDSDHELAMRLQAEEDRRANAHQQQMANQQHLSQQHQQRVAQEAKEKKKEKSES